MTITKEDLLRTDTTIVVSCLRGLDTDYAYVVARRKYCISKIEPLSIGEHTPLIDKEWRDIRGGGGRDA